MVSDFPRPFADEAPHALVAVTPAGPILYWNRGAEAIFGHSAEEAAGKLLAELTVPAGRLAEEESNLPQALEAGRGVYESLPRKQAGPLICVTLTLPLAAWERTAA
jgi:PAS domain S-box-containing protein